MSRLFREPTLLIASGNKGKVKEIQELLVDFPVDVVSTDGFMVVEPDETGKTFIENALLKAEYYGKRTGLPALADDSGLAVEILDGAPGIYSARWAGDGKDFSLAFNRLKKEVELILEDDDSPVRACFICALALRWPDGYSETVEGRVYGTLSFPPRGKNGFGYDPIFVPNGETRSFGELSAAEKRAISHRSDAFRKLVAKCFRSDEKINATARNA